MQREIPPDVWRGVRAILMPYLGSDVDKLLSACNSTKESPQSPLSDWCDVVEAQRITHVSRWTLMRRAEDGILKVHKLGHCRCSKILFERKSLIDWINSCEISLTKTGKGN